jgi:hypothetical protein
MTFAPPQDTSLVLSVEPVSVPVIVEDPVYVYVVDMVVQLADMASGAGHAALGACLREVAASAGF